MRIARFCIIVFFVVLQDVRMSYGEVLLTAQYNVIASADARELGLGNSKRTIAIGGLKDEPTSGPLAFADFAEAQHGGSVAIIQAYANAEIGKIGIGIVGTVQSSHFSGQPPLPPIAFGGGEAKVEIGILEAGWAEIAKVNAPGRSPGELLRIRSILQLDGESISNPHLGEFDLPGGQAEATLQLFERTDNYDLPPSPYSNGAWAHLYDNPPLKIVEDVPGAVRYEYFHRVGQNSAFDFNFRLLGYTRAVNGGSSSLTADFTGSLKWGGIESVTDLAGNVIPRDEWSIESESGFDYARSWDEQQVPEPSNVLLLGTALCLGSRRIKRCKSPAPASSRLLPGSPLLLSPGQGGS
jgi:hypothetical protein